jgi:tetratricopeptide (TPR) repeat protein
VQALLGDISEKQGKFLQAAEHLQAAAKLDPSEANLYSLGMEYLKHWTFPPALQFFQYGVNLYPSSQRMRLGLGIVHYSMNQLAEAAHIFAQLLDEYSENATYAELLGRSCTLMPDAIVECEKLEHHAETNPQNAAVDTYAATSILARPDETANLAVAGKLLDAAIRIEPTSAEAHFQKGSLLQDLDRWKDSISELETSIALKPESSKAHYRLALAYIHIGNREKGKEQIGLQKKFRELERDRVSARFNEVQMFLVNAP